MQAGLNKFSVIIGVGNTGMSCASYLAAKGLPFKLVDTRVTPPNIELIKALYPGVECEFGQLRLQTLLDARELIVSPGVSLATAEIQLAIEAGVSISSDIDIFSKVAPAPIIAVTGSNGKSSVVTLLANIFDEAGISYGLGGNLDGDRQRPALELLDQSDVEFYILELSSFQLETTQMLNAKVSALLNLSEDHMDRYEGLGEYLKAKQRIFKGSEKIVINRDDENSQSPGAGVEESHFSTRAINKQGFGVSQCPSEASSRDEYITHGEDKIIAVSELKIRGRHNLSNLLAAASLAKAVDVDLSSIVKGLRNFSGLAHRSQWLRTLNQVSFYNDSKGTNVGASVAAIESLGEHVEGRIILIAGGVGKGADFSALARVIIKWVARVILIGKDASIMAQRINRDVKTVFAQDMQQAVELAYADAKPGDAVLLSPACASFDMFENYRHRGEVFASAVGGLS